MMLFEHLFGIAGVITAVSFYIHNCQSVVTTLVNDY